MALDAETAGAKSHSFKEWLETHAPEEMRQLNPDLRFTDAVSLLKSVLAEQHQFDVIHFDEPYGTTGAVWDTVIPDDYMQVRHRR